MIELLLMLFIGGMDSGDTLDYELVFSSSWKDCNERNGNAMSFYNSVIYEYLKMNGLSPRAKYISCKNFNDVFPTYPIKSNVDLTIIIPDWIQSNIYAYTQHQRGIHYYNPNQGDVIVSTSLGYDHKNHASVWTLSHELMHFVIDYKGYDNSLQEMYVHKMQEDMNNCIYLEQCQNVWDAVEIDNTKFLVMAPIKSYKDNLVSEKNVEPKKKISTNISSMINGNVQIQISGVENVCHWASLVEAGTGNRIPNAPLTMYYTINIDGKTYSSKKSVYTDSQGIFHQCSDYGSEVSSSWNFYYEYDGNNKYFSSKSSLMKMSVI